jgi:RNA polymerase sigma factor (sigma-70 family)
MDAERLFLDQLPLVDRILAATCRRHRLTKEEGEDFASAVKLKLIANDYQVLRAFQGKSSLGGYLAAVVQRAWLDHCNQLWGKWRPSAAAKRMGPLAVRLDTLLHRDGLTLDEACASAPPEDRAEMQRLALKLPPRVRRRMGDEEELATVAAGDGSPEAGLIERERATAAERLEEALEGALGQLDDEDRLLVQLRLQQGLTLVSVARAFGVDARTLYRRWENLLRKLRTALEQRGYDVSQVSWVLEAGGAVASEAGSRRPGPSSIEGASTAMIEAVQSCPSIEEVAAFAEGRLAGADRERVISHLASCVDCASCWRARSRRSTRWVSR